MPVHHSPSNFSTSSHNQGRSFTDLPMSVRAGRPVEKRTIDSGSLRHIAQKDGVSAVSPRCRRPP